MVTSLLLYVQLADIRVRSKRTTVVRARARIPVHGPRVLERWPLLPWIAANGLVGKWERHKISRQPFTVCLKDLMTATNGSNDGRAYVNRQSFTSKMLKLH